MGKKSIRKKAMIRASRKKVPESGLTFLFVLIAIVLVVWTIPNTHQSLIPRLHLWAVVLAGSLLCMILITRLGNASMKTGMATLACFLLGGAVAFFTLVNINYYGRSATTRQITLPALEKGTKSAGRSGQRYKRPFIVVAYKGQEHKILFGPRMLEQLESANAVVLTIADGAFNYPVCLEKTMIP